MWQGLFILEEGVCDNLGSLLTLIFHQVFTVMLMF